MDGQPPSRPDRGNSSSGPLPPGFDLSTDAWADPAEERTLLRRRLLRYRLGFSALGLALVIASLSTIGSLILLFSDVRQPPGALLGIPHWRLIEQSLVVWGSLLGVFLLCGGWPDQQWQRRSGLLLLMCLVDAVLWSLDHATVLGLYEGKVGHEWFRQSLGDAIGWSEFALIASLTADMAAHLGEPQAIEFGKARAVVGDPRLGNLVHVLLLPDELEQLLAVAEPAASGRDDHAPARMVDSLCTQLDSGDRALPARWPMLRTDSPRDGRGGSSAKPVPFPLRDRMG